jgi:uncharacterized protein YacL
MIEWIQLAIVIVILLLVIPKNRKKPSKAMGGEIILDSCVIIDGRIADLVESGFIRDTLIIPTFIIRELQVLADAKDRQKRERARFGLEVVRRLQDKNNGNVRVYECEPNQSAVDDKLIALAKEREATILTTDFNLAQVAEIEGVATLNINTLAQIIRPAALPGEVRKVKIIQKGNGQKQGVGYLPDGTMVVVENANKLLGKTIEVEITQNHQTVSGKMLFAQAKKSNSHNTR